MSRIIEEGETSIEEGRIEEERSLSRKGDYEQGLQFYILVKRVKPKTDKYKEY